MRAVIHASWIKPHFHTFVTSIQSYIHARWLKPHFYTRHIHASLLKPHFLYFCYMHAVIHASWLKANVSHFCHMQAVIQSQIQNYYFLYTLVTCMEPHKRCLQNHFHTFCLTKLASTQAQVTFANHMFIVQRPTCI